MSDAGERILVTPRSLSKGGHPALDALTAGGYEVVFPAPGRQPGEAELLKVVGDCVGYLAGVEPITARVLTAASRLKVISRNGTGIENIDLAMQEGYSTATPEMREMGFGAGMGLPNIRRNSDIFDIASQPGRGTRVEIIINAG